VWHLLKATTLMLLDSQLKLSAILVTTARLAQLPRLLAPWVNHPRLVVSQQTHAPMRRPVFTDRAQQFLAPLLMVTTHPQLESTTPFQRDLVLSAHQAASARAVLLLIALLELAVKMNLHQQT